LVEQGGFSAAGGAQQHNELAGVQIEIDAAQRGHGGFALSVNPREIPDVKYRLM
jgi:hypothetical protein